MGECAFTNFSVWQKEVVIITSALTALAVAGTLWYQKHRRSSFPKSWEPVGKVKKLFVYPLKSAHRIELQSGECTGYGIKQLEEDSPNYQLRDRELIVYAENSHEFRCGRHFPKLLLVELKVADENHFEISAPGMTPLVVPIPKPGEKKEQEVDFFLHEKIFMNDCGTDAARWLSKFLLDKDNGLRLGFHDGNHRRDLTVLFKDFFPVYKNLNNESTGMYSNLTSYLLVNQNSVNDLNSKIPDSEVTFNNFRPNILIDGVSPFAEDDWDWIKIGDVVFRLLKPRTRCIMTTVNPETGVRDKNREPLKTLETYRLSSDPKRRALEPNMPVMGVDLGLRKPGIIHVNDTVYIGKN